MADDLTPEEQEELQRREAVGRKGLPGQPTQPQNLTDLGIDPGVAKLISNAKSITDQVSRTTPGDIANVGARGIRTFFDNILSIPQGIGEALALGAGGFQTLVETPFVDGDFGDRFDQNVQGQRDFSPVSGLVNAPRVQTADILAAGDGLQNFMGGRERQMEARMRGETPEEINGLGTQIKRERLLQGFQDQANEAVNPISTFLGNTAGDIATIATGRAPRVQGLARSQSAERAALSKRVGRDFPGLTGGEISAVVRNRLDDQASRIAESFLGGKPKNFPVVTGAAAGKIKRGAGRAVRVGVESAGLELLKDNGPDAPLKRFAFGAGAQSVGSLGLTLLNSKSGRIAAAGATAFFAYGIMKDLGPGDARFFESQDFAIDTLKKAFVLGAMGAITGAGRFRSASQEKLPVFFDAITQGQRTLSRNFFTEMIDSKENNGIEFKVLGKMATDPSFFNANQTNSLGRAMMSDKEGAFSREVERLMKESPDFAALLDDL